MVAMSGPVWRRRYPFELSLSNARGEGRDQGCARSSMKKAREQWRDRLCLQTVRRFDFFRDRNFTGLIPRI
jgi:hypothetical protein